LEQIVFLSFGHKLHVFMFWYLFKELVTNHLARHPKSLVAVGSYTIGKERIFMALAEELNCKIWANTEKRRVLKAIGDEAS
jgi:hypothetical protein